MAVLDGHYLIVLSVAVCSLCQEVSENMLLRSMYRCDGQSVEFAGGAVTAQHVRVRVGSIE
jgi:hypothetical protein